MATLFGIINLHWLWVSLTVVTLTAKHYCDTFERIRLAVRRKRSGWLCAITPRLAQLSELATDCGDRAERLWITLLTVPISRRVISISLDLLRSTWLASNLQQTPTWSKRLLPACRYLTQISSTAQCKLWCHSGTNAEVSVVTTWNSDMYYL